MKKLLTSVVIAALSAPIVALASGPVIYGKLHVSVDGIDDGKNSDVAVASNSSYLGIKGSEEMDNGLTVGYLYEWQVNVAGEGGDLAMRNRWINLGNDSMGKVQIGYFDLPFKAVGRKFDLFGDQIGDLRTITRHYEAREGNMIAYVTPDLSGFNAVVGYVADAHADQLDDNSHDAWSGSLNYTNGPIDLSLGYVNLSEGALGATRDSDAYRLGLGFDMGDLKVNATYTDYNDVNGVKGLDPNVWSLGAAYTMASNTLKLQYANRDSDIKKADSQLWAVGVDHKMSKRTKAYIAYSLSDNDSAAAYTPWAGGHGVSTPGIAGKNADAWSVGLMHSF